MKRRNLRPENREIAKIRGGILSFALAASLALPNVSFAAPSAPQDAADVSEETEDWLDSMAAYYEAHPELKTTKSSGWKPYNRIKWFAEQRDVNGEPPPIGARALAWQAKREIERTSSPAPRASWFSIGPANFSGRLLSIEFDPNDSNVVYVGSAGGGLWRSTSGGVGWESLTDETASLAVGGVGVLPSNSDVIVIATGEGTPNIDRIAGVGILRSTDGGGSWIETSLSYSKANGHGFHVLEVNPATGTMLAGGTDGLWRSADEGATWSQVRIGGNYYDVVWKPGSANVCYTVRGGTGSGNGVKVSTDDGVSWNATGSGGPLATLVGKSKLAVSADEPSWIYGAFSNRSSSAFLGCYRSTDDGASWTLRATTPNMYGGQGWYDVSFAADPNDADRLISGGVGLYRSTDGGTTFDGIGGNVHVDHHAAAYRPGSPDNVFVGSDGGIWESANDGDAWTDRNAGLVTYQFYDICVAQASPTFVMGGTQDNGTDKWSGTTTWSEGLFADGMVCNISPNGTNVVYGEIQFGDHYKSTTGGFSWFSINNGITGSGQWVTAVAEDQTTGNSNHLYTASTGGIFRTTNGGTNWVNVASHTANWIDLSPIDGDVVWTAAGTSVKRTTDDGGSWADAAPFGFPSGSVMKIAADPFNLDGAYVSFSGYNAGIAHVAKTADGGATWTDLTGNLPSMPVNAIAPDNLDPTRIYIGTDVGVWATTNGGTSWAPFEVGLPNTVISDLEIQKSSRKLVAGTHGRGAWEVSITDGPSTGVEVATAPTLHLMFDPPAPNPISRDTLFRFAAKYPGEVTLSVYDVNGRLVNEVVRAPSGDGIIRFAPWVADDVPSGVYFAVLKAGSEKISRKIVVAK